MSNWGPDLFVLFVLFVLFCHTTVDVDVNTFMPHILQLLCLLMDSQYDDAVSQLHYPTPVEHFTIGADPRAFHVQIVRQTAAYGKPNDSHGGCDTGVVTLEFHENSCRNWQDDAIARSIWVGCTLEALGEKIDE